MVSLRLALPDGARADCCALLLDMDGVLVDSLPTIERHLRDWSLKHELDWRHVVEVSPGRTNTELVALVAPHLNPQAEAERMLEREVTDTQGISACRGAIDLVSRLPDSSWAVVTSGHRAVAHARLTAAHLPVPRVLITADDVRAGKPDPQGYRAAARLLRVEASDCLIIEDAPAGIAAARTAGMRSIMITDNVGQPVVSSDYSVTGLDDLTLTIVDNCGPQQPC